jgi:hypothetical protein
VPHSQAVLQRPQVSQQALQKPAQQWLLPQALLGGVAASPQHRGQHSKEAASQRWRRRGEAHRAQGCCRQALYVSLLHCSAVLRVVRRHPY